ncbi:hypothetical protein LTS16_021426 [Friedmanniomyces endolithicus]|nr:hypothetical protein LTS01_002748 [Friedmanniomyces endolithicus]KAK1027490.1 hypothetical protein LTS16_021426 [Friedmanniomyces endolithicus]
MLALIYVGIFAVVGFFARLDITQTALFSFPTLAKMLDAPPPHSGVLSDYSVITATPDDDAVTIVWSEWVTPTPTPTPAFRLVCPLNGATHGIIPGVTTCEVRSTSATMADEGVSWPGDIPSLELGTPSFPVASAMLLTSLFLGAGLLVVYRCLLLVLGISLAEMHAPQQEQTARPAVEATPKTRLLTRYGPVDAAGDLTTRKLARPPTSAKTEGSVWVSRLCAERAASVAGEEQQKKKKNKKKQPLRACWKGERAEQEKPALRSAMHWGGVEEEGTPAGGPLQVLRTGDAAESAAGVASGADGGKRADTKAPSHAGGDGRATPRSTVSPVVEVKSGQAAGSTTAPGGGGGVEKAKRGVVIRGTRGGRSARGGAVSRRSLGGGESARSASATNWSGSRHAATSAPPPPPPATPHSASAPAAPAQARIGGPMSWEPTDDAVDALALDLADMNFLAPGEHALDMEDVTWHSTAPTHPGDIIMAETLPNPAPASGLAAPPAGDVCMADVAPNGAPDVQLADAVVAEGVPIAMQAVGAALALPICFYRAPMPAQQLPQAQAAWPSQEVQTAQVAQAVSQEVQAAQAVQAVRVQDVQAYVAAQVPTIHQAPMPAQQQPRTNRLAGAARKPLGGSPLRSMSNARPTPAKVSADVTPGPTEHEMYCPRENCGQITWKSMATCKVCKEKKPGAETATYAIPGDYQPYGNE